MRVKLKILLCALFVLGFAVSQAYAQQAVTGGFLISKKTTTVAQYGTNQLMGGLRFTYQPDVDNVLTFGRTIEVSFGGLAILEEGNGNDVSCSNGLDCSQITVAAANDDDDVNGKVTITLAEGLVPAKGEHFTLSGVRADVSDLAVGDTVTATMTSSEAADDFVFVPIDDGATATTKSTVVAEVKAGLVVEVAQSSKLVCAVDTSGPDPVITVKEGFAGAWVVDATNGVDGSTQVRIELDGLPAGVTLTWPGSDDDLEADIPKENPTHLYDDDDNDETVKVIGATLEFVEAKEDYVIYEFAGGPDAGSVNSFAIAPAVAVDASEVGVGGVTTAGVRLWPEPNDDNDKLAFKYPLISDPDEGNEFLNVADCVTYLLFPFVTCGATEGWTTGIAIANTSSDEGIFGIDEGAEAQSGPVTMWGFPRSEASADGSSGEVPDSVRVEVTPNLAAGDTFSVSCDAAMPGFEGYVIAKASFQHAHGVAFVLGDFQDGATFDVAHGYLALVIPDPEFKEVGGRSADASGGESLGQ